METNIVAPNNTNGIAYKLRDYFRKQRYEAMLNPYAARRKKMSIAASLMLVLLSSIGIYSATLISQQDLEPEAGRAFNTEAPKIVKRGVAISGNVYCKTGSGDRLYLDNVEISLEGSNGTLATELTSTDPIGGDGYYVFTNITADDGPFNLSASLGDESLVLENGDLYSKFFDSLQAQNCENKLGLLCDLNDGSVCGDDSTSYDSCSMSPGIHTRFDFAFSGCGEDTKNITTTKVASPTVEPTSVSENGGLIEGKVWLDVDADGVRGEEENKLKGIKVNLLNSSQEKVTSTTTSKSGSYKFKEVDPGNYFVEFDFGNKNYDYTRAGVGTDECKDSNINSHNGQSFILTIKDGVVKSCVDAGFIIKPTATPTSPVLASKKPSATTKPTEVISPTITNDDIPTPIVTPTVQPTVKVTLSPTIVPSVQPTESQNTSVNEVISQEGLVSTSYKVQCKENSVDLENYQISIEIESSDRLDIVYRFDSSLDASNLEVSDISQSGEYKDGVISWRDVEVSKGELLDLVFKANLKDESYGQYVSTIEVKGEDTSLVESVRFTAFCLPSTAVDSSRLIPLSIALLISSVAFAVLAMGYDERIGAYFFDKTGLGDKEKKENFETTILE